MKKSTWHLLISALALMSVIFMLSGCTSKKSGTSSASKSSVKNKTQTKSAKAASQKAKKLTAEEKALQKKTKAIFKGITLSLVGTKEHPIVDWDKPTLLTNIATYLAKQDGADPATVLAIIKVKETAEKIPNEKQTVDGYASFGPLGFPDMFETYYDSGIALTGEQKAALDNVASDLDDLTVNLSAGSNENLGYDKPGYHANLSVYDSSGFGVEINKNFAHMPKPKAINVRELLTNHLYIHMTGWEGTEDTIKGIYLDQPTLSQISQLMGTMLEPDAVNALWDIRNNTLKYRPGDTVTIDFDSLASKLAELTPNTASVTWYGDGQGPTVLKAE